jgi:hypothetical protein
MHGNQIYWLLNGAQFIPQGTSDQRASDRRLETGRILPAKHAGDGRRSARERIATFMKRR